MTHTPSQPPAAGDLQQLLLQAVQTGSANYFAQCKARIDPFARRHFQYPGALRTNRHALGWDLLRAPLNLLWAPCYVSLMLLAWSCKRLGWGGLGRKLGRAPLGLDTRVQAYLVTVTCRELLQRPLVPGDPDGLKAAIEQAMARQIGVMDLDERLDDGLARKIDLLVDEALDHYGVGRMATADIANSVISMLVGAFAFQKYTPGGLAIGIYSAAVVARWLAVDNFWAGPWLGQWYYSLVPVAPGFAVILACLLLSLTLLAVTACFSGVLLDPLQAAVGLHQWRLKRLIDHLEKDARLRTASSFKPKEPYLARVLDLIDMARTQIA